MQHTVPALVGQRGAMTGAGSYTGGGIPRLQRSYCESFGKPNRDSLKHLPPHVREQFSGKNPNFNSKSMKAIGNRHSGGAQQAQAAHDYPSNQLMSPSLKFMMTVTLMHDPRHAFPTEIPYHVYRSTRDRFRIVFACLWMVVMFGLYENAIDYGRSWKGKGGVEEVYTITSGGRGKSGNIGSGSAASGGESEQGQRGSE
eukprot:Nk52_evm21s1360 gene=Nk52_evmTU21s1360